MGVLPVINHNIKAKTITPVNDQILIKLFSQEKKTAGGILLPEHSSKDPLKTGIIVKGEVLEISEKLLNVYKDDTEPTISVGDVVTFVKKPGITLRHNDEYEVVLLDIEEVIGKEPK